MQPDASLLARVSATVDCGKMTLEIAAVVENTSHLDHAFVQMAVKKKMTGRSYNQAGYSISAELKMVGTRAFDHHLWTLFRSGADGIVADIK